MPKRVLYDLGMAQRMVGGRFKTISTGAGDQPGITRVMGLGFHRDDKPVGPENGFAGFLLYNTSFWEEIGMEEGIRYRRVRNVLLWVLVLNWAVALAKIFFGRAIGSASMTADGYHSFADGASNIIGLVGIAIAARPADRDHPYGHKKYETFTAIAIAILLFLVSVDILRNAFGRLANPVVPDVKSTSFLVMIITMIINIIVVRTEYGAGRELESDILVSDSLHTKSDIYVSISVFATLIAVKFGVTWLDMIAAVVIAGLIIRAGIQVLRQSSDVLCDRTPIKPDEIKEIVLSVPGIQDCHMIRTRGRLDDMYIDLHILVDENMPVEEAHELANTVEQHLKKEIAGVSDVVVHIEPENQHETEEDDDTLSLSNDKQ